MTAHEKQLEGRVAMLERQIRDIRKSLGMDEAEILEAERAEEYEAAMEHLHRSGDAGLLKDHLRKWNGKSGRAA